MRISDWSSDVCSSDLQQVKLLRVLEQSTVTRLGSTVEIPVQFRLVAATHRHLPTLVEGGRFRADLYYRLAVIELYVPNLEQRGPDEKAAIFNVLLAAAMPGNADPVPSWVVERVSRTHFAGNVRELSNLAKREIGRASGRERGCQYVEISVGA